MKSEKYKMKNGTCKNQHPGEGKFSGRYQLNKGGGKCIRQK